jgi:RING finger and CHY zinc finger domain-containing protein 1
MIGSASVPHVCMSISCCFWVWSHYFLFYTYYYSNHCVQCGIQFGEYHCNICNLWMSNEESPYHCADCGFCRVGGRENFRHCHDCGMCIDALLLDDHNCQSGKYMSDCPICREDLFSSRLASHEMPCGHAIHWHCFQELTTYDTRCPVCKKTAETPEQMAVTWNAIAMGIALQPVPPDLARVVHIFCNDCETSDHNRRWHFLGVRCLDCLSFNTTVEQIVLRGVEAAEYLDELEASRSCGDSGVPANISVQVAAASTSTSTSTTRTSNNNNNNRSLDEAMATEQDTSSSSESFPGQNMEF